MTRAHNFSAGPCTLPVEVLEALQAEMVDYQESGMSLIEMSHRGQHFDAVFEEAIALVREQYGVPNEFEILLLQGGATLQFSMVPMNLLGDGARAAYVNSGHWAKGAIADARYYGDVYVAWDGKADRYARMPITEELELFPNTRYLHITSNETIGGIRYFEWPEVEVPLVADMSSDYMTRPIPWSRFDLVYGGVQKNLGPAGLAMVIVRRSALDDASDKIGQYLRYSVQVDKSSMFNTPPVFAIYVLGKVLKWMKKKGGLEGIELEANRKASLLYNAIDESNGYYDCPVTSAYRSVMNVVFRLPTEKLEEQFLREASAADLVNLKGHRTVGGCRASIYNAMPMESVAVLTQFMQDFCSRNPA
ncbi:MAG TPA: 3-phosphoserine/phosphohydroxythreonine transaminase [Gammaproteobacteria bacterium]|jgi:phosphoserine aminotransferase|nr:3-phosphoserine/phosphohydroxythreonine transaminase [Gammaproteobacteria bacterium]